jgi:dipeptidyl aminopeptidase/acylaminoacyl peptidase
MVPLSIVVENIFFLSEGNTLLGRIYRPAPEGKYPAVVICHAYPGDTKNMDLAEELALKGIVTLVFYYQGAWGSKGVYRFTKLETSTRDAVAFLREQPCVDPNSIGLVSHSMGALPLTKLMSLDSTIKTGVMIAPVSDIGLWTGGDMLETVVRSFIESARGKLEGMTPDQVRADLREVTKTGNPVKLIGDVKSPIMMLVGTSDEVTPPEVCKILYDKAREPKRWVLIQGADHSFSEHRIPLIKAVLDWLRVSL